MPDVSIVSCKSYEEAEVRRALTEALAPFGLDWVKPGMRIAVKVNLVGAHKPEEAATTHPMPLRCLVEMLTARGATVVIGDSPGGLFTAGYLAPIYAASGMREALLPGASLNDDFTDVEVPFPEGVAAKAYRCVRFIAEADAVIDFCKPKTHGMMAYTGACKNFFGTVPGLMKGEYHYRFSDYARFAEMLVDLAESIKPRLCLADYVWSMEGNGPTKGTPRFVGALMASVCPHRMDLAGAAVMGFTARDVPTLQAAFRRGLIPEDVSALDIAGDLDSFKLSDFKPAARRAISAWSGDNALVTKLSLAFLASKPAVAADCIGCGKCAQVCPAKAIQMKNKRPHIDRRLCIRCFCCQEFCPKGAMRVHRPVMARLLNR